MTVRKSSYHPLQRPQRPLLWGCVLAHNVDLQHPLCVFFSSWWVQGKADKRTWPRQRKTATKESTWTIWDIEKDTFIFWVTLQDRQLTPWGVFAVVSSVYDPLGFLAPVILKAKHIIQELCKVKCGACWAESEQDGGNWWLFKMRATVEDLTRPICFWNYVHIIFIFTSTCFSKMFITRDSWEEITESKQQRDGDISMRLQGALLTSGLLSA